MRDPIENITLLQRQINELQIENQLLKNLLSQNGVFYEKSLLQFLRKASDLVKKRTAQTAALI